MVNLPTHGFVPNGRLSASVKSKCDPGQGPRSGVAQATGAASLTPDPSPNPAIENLFRASDRHRLRRTGLAPATYDVIMRDRMRLLRPMTANA
jgi:hypothetical protein